MKTLALAVPGGLDLDLVARSHGWYDLSPFAWDPDSHRLSFVALHHGHASEAGVKATGGGPGAPFRVEVRPRATGVTLVTDGPAEAARAVTRRVLDLDSDLSSFHQACREASAPGFSWMADRRAGRILRAPTVFEDAVKVLLTTNCSWSLTRSMVQNLTAMFGREGAFPDAPFLAGLTEESLRQEGRLGYRAPFLLGFATRVASGGLDLATWEDPGSDDETTEKAIRSVPGFGPYAAQTMGRLLGRHAGLGVDSWSRKKIAELRFKGRAVPDRRIETFYRPFGRFAGLAFWLDVTRAWHEGEERLWP